MNRGRATLALVLIPAVLVVVIALPTAQGSAALPSTIDLLSASIEQHPPFNEKGVADRAITVRFELAGHPSCSSSGPQPAYALLLDAFPWYRNHLILPEVTELRFQSAISIRCDTATSSFRSNVKGTVAIEPSSHAAGAHSLVLRTTLNQLPSVEFRWVAIASYGEQYSRAPRAGGYTRWAIHERTVR